MKRNYPDTFLALYFLIMIPISLIIFGPFIVFIWFIVLKRDIFKNQIKNFVEFLKLGFNDAIFCIKTGKPLG